MTGDRPPDDRAPDDRRDRPADDERAGDQRAGDQQAGDQPTEFDWQSPRWRDSDEQQRDTEHEHRFRDDVAPKQRGAIDRDRSVGEKRRGGGPTEK